MQDQDLRSDTISRVPWHRSIYIADKFDICVSPEDIEFCKVRYPNVLCKPIALQFLTENDVAILELSVDEEDQIFRLSVVDERHYKLVAKDGITEAEIKKICDRE